MWPVLDTTARRAAYYSVGEGRAEVALVDLPPTSALSAGARFTVTITTLTQQAGSSGLHVDYQVSPTNALVFSPEGEWVAFPGHAVSGKALELFVAHTKGGKVLQVTDKGWMVREYIWVSRDAILVTLERPDGRSQQWKATLSADIVTLERIQ
jgi:hypothetical protein